MKWYKGRAIFIRSLRNFVNSIGDKFGEVSSTPLQRLLLVSLKARLYHLQKKLIDSKLKI